MKIRIAGYINESIVDGPGIRFTVFTQGCIFNCPGCHNIDTHDLNGGYLSDTDNLINLLSKSFLATGLTISGGEPFLQPEAVLDLIIKAKPLVQNIIIYSGYTYEELVKFAKTNPIYATILSKADYLVDGRFIQEKKDLTLEYRGSSNQRIIDLHKTTIEQIVLKSFKGF